MHISIHICIIHKKTDKVQICEHLNIHLNININIFKTKGNAEIGSSELLRT